MTIYEQIREWALDRGITQSGDPKTQMLKVQEEVGELSKAILEKDGIGIKDGIGDVVVTLTSLATLCGMQIEECIEEAYNIIKHRRGEMVDGTFKREK